MECKDCEPCCVWASAGVIVCIQVKEIAYVSKWRQVGLNHSSALYRATTVHHLLKITCTNYLRINEQYCSGHETTTQPTRDYFQPLLHTVVLKTRRLNDPCLIVMSTLSAAVLTWRWLSKCCHINSSSFLLQFLQQRCFDSLGQGRCNSKQYWSQGTSAEATNLVSPTRPICHRRVQNTSPTLASVTQTPWGGSIVKPLTPAWGKCAS